jgi:FtsZ-interacting cell division protein ZipA
MEPQNTSNMTTPLLNENITSINLPNNTKTSFNFLSIFYKYKYYLIAFVIAIIISLLFYLYKKKKGKKSMLNVIEPNNKNKLLYNPVEKQYYDLDDSGNMSKTTLEIYQKQNKQNVNPPQKKYMREYQTQIEHPNQRINNRPSQLEHTNKPQEQSMQSQNKKLAHVSESVETTESIQYDISQLDDNVNISQYNLNSEDINQINVELSE